MSQDGAGSPPMPADAGSKSDDEAPMFDWRKKATLIFLGSVGMTLLLTGATGRRMIKKPPSVAPNAPSTSTFVPPAKPSIPKSSKQPPLAFIKSIPGVSAPPPRRSSSRLRHLFQTSPAPSTPLNFLANEHAPWKKELPTPTLLSSMVDVEEAGPEPAPEDKANALLDAVKAFTLATTITVGTAAAGVYFLTRYLGANDIPSFMHELREQIMQPFARSVAGSDFLPDFMKLKEGPRTPESLRSEQEDEEELRQIFERGWRDLLKQTGQSENEMTASQPGDSVVEIRKT